MTRIILACLPAATSLSALANVLGCGRSNKQPELELARSFGVRLSAERAFSNYSSPQNELSLQLRWYYY